MSFDPDQPRDEDGKWTGGGGDSKRDPELKAALEALPPMGEYGETWITEAGKMPEIDGQHWEAAEELGARIRESHYEEDMQRFAEQTGAVRAGFTAHYAYAQFYQPPTEAQVTAIARRLGRDGQFMLEYGGGVSQGGRGAGEFRRLVEEQYPPKTNRWSQG